MDYRLLLLIHVLAAMTWVGAAVVIPISLLRAQRSGDPGDAERAMHSLRWADTWLAIPMPLLVGGSGVWMVLQSGSWSFDQAWILGSIVLMVAYQLIALLWGGRLYRQLRRAQAAGAAGVDEAGRAVAAIGRLGLVLLAALVAAVWAMVYRPGL